MTIKIVVDSACDLPEQIVRDNGIVVVPIYINIGDKSFRDGVDLPRESFYRQLPQFQPPATTATPSPEVFKRVYQQLADQGASAILSIHLSVSLSSTVESARRAAAETTTVPVTVLDSQQLSLGAGFLAITAARAAARGASMDEILAVLQDQMRRTYVFAALDTLEYLKRSGRMNGTVSMLGNLFQIKPILRMHAGKPTSEKVRTQRRANKRLLDLLKSYEPLEKMALLHANAPERAEALLQQINPGLADIDIVRAEISPVLGVHIGPGVVGFVCITRQV